MLERQYLTWTMRGGGRGGYSCEKFDSSVTPLKSFCCLELELVLDVSTTSRSGKEPFHRVKVKVRGEPASFLVVFLEMVS